MVLINVDWLILQQGWMVSVLHCSTPDSGGTWGTRVLANILITIL